MTAPPEIRGEQHLWPNASDCCRNWRSGSFSGTSGAEEVSGDGTRACLAVYLARESEAAAVVCASRLLRRRKVRTRASEEAAEVAKLRLRSCCEFVPEALRTLGLA